LGVTYRAQYVLCAQTIDSIGAKTFPYRPYHRYTDISRRPPVYHCRCSRGAYGTIFGQVVARYIALPMVEIPLRSAAARFQDGDRSLTSSEPALSEVMHVLTELILIS
jgi:hypothetical protein